MFFKGIRSWITGDKLTFRNITFCENRYENRSNKIQTIGPDTDG